MPRRSILAAAVASSLLLAACGTGGGGGASPQPDLTLRRVSVSSTGSASTGASRWVDISANGRYVAFAASGGDLVAGVAPGFWQVYVRDLVAGTTVLASASATGVAGDGHCLGRPAVSNDGRWVAFASHATNLIAADSATRDVYVKDLTTGTVVRAQSGGTPPNDESMLADMTPDGRYVLLTSEANNLVTGDSNGVRDVFRWDRTSGTVVRASLTDADGQPTNGAALYVSTILVASISDDGDRVAFYHGGVDLVAGDTNGYGDVFVRDIGDATTVRVSLTESDGQIMTSESYDPDISGDGTRVLFASEATDAVAADTHGLSDLFVRDLVAGTTVCASLNISGTPSRTAVYEGRISGDGTRVALVSSAALTPRAAPPASDVFVRRLGGGIIRVSHGPGGASNRPSTSPALSADGLTIAFSSGATTLIADDTNSADDVFVAVLSPSAGG